MLLLLMLLLLLLLLILSGPGAHDCESVRWIEIQITFPLTIFLKHGQLDFSKAFDSISDYLTVIFLGHFVLLLLLSGRGAGGGWEGPL